MADMMNDAFEIALAFAVALFRATGPTVNTRVHYNCTRDGGTVFLATASVGGYDRVEYIRVEADGTPLRLNRSGEQWKWER